MDRREDDHLVLRTSRLILKRGTLPSWAPRGVIKSTESWVLEETEVDVEPPRMSVLPAAGSDSPPLLDTYDGGKSQVKIESHANCASPPVPARQMRVWTRNLDHTNVLAVTEGLTLYEAAGHDPLDSRTSSSIPGRSEGQASSPSPSPAGQPASSKGESLTSPLLSFRTPLTIPTPTQGPMYTHTHMRTRGHVVSSLGFSLLRGRVEKFGVNRFRAHADTSRAGLVWAADGVLGLAGAHLLESGKYPSSAPTTSTTSALPPPSAAGTPSKISVPTHTPPERPEDLGGGRIATAVRRLAWRFRRPHVPSEEERQQQREDEEESETKWQTKLRAALRPPFLDGYPPTPLQRMRTWIWGEQGRVAQAREAEERIRWAYKARRWLGRSRDQPSGTLGEHLSPPKAREGGRGYMPLWSQRRRVPEGDEGDDDANRVDRRKTEADAEEEHEPLLGHDYRDGIPMPV